MSFVGLRSKQSNRISGALQALASACADDVAELFPFPHHGFFDLSPARMHLLGLTLVSSRLDHIDIDRLTAVKFADAAVLLAEPTPTGIEGILSRMPLPMWTLEQYRDLLELFDCRKAKQTLQHAERIDPSLVGILVRLTPALRTVRVTQHIRHVREAEVLSRVLKTDAEADAFLRTLAANECRENFYRKLIEDFRRRQGFPMLPQIDHELVQPVSDLAELGSVAIEFSNCLRVFAEEIISGGVGFYVWRGEESAVISVRPRMYGLIVDEVRGAANLRISGATDARIRAVFAAHGIGRPQAEAWNERAEECLSSLRCLGGDGQDEIEAACSMFLDSK